MSCRILFNFFVVFACQGMRGRIACTAAVQLEIFQGIQYRVVLFVNIRHFVRKGANRIEMIFIQMDLT
jgi:hypothetical protein